MRNQVFKKLFSVLLALIMVAGLLPASAMAGGWGAMDVDTTPVPTGTVQPTESAEPTDPAETETPEVTEVPEPTPENPAATVEPTQGEPTAEPTDEGIMPANVMPVQADVELQYRIVHLDCGRKYFSKDWIIALMYEAKAAGYNQIQLAFGNDGLRFLLDDMSFTVNGTTYSHETVVSKVEAGNKAQNSSGDARWLTQSEMNEIIIAANTLGIEIVPLLNLPGHANAILDIAEDGYNASVYGKTSQNTLAVTNSNACEFAYALFTKYVDYFAGNGCKFFNFGADEYGNDVDGNPHFDALGSSNYKDYFAPFINRLAAYIVSKGMTPRTFNDGLYYNKTNPWNMNTSTNTSIAKIQCCYWSSGWGSYPVATASQIFNNGHSMINTHGDYYYVLGKDDAFTPGTSTTHDVSLYTAAANFNNNTFAGGDTISSVGSMFCIWCDYPNAESEQQVAANVRFVLRAMAQRMEGNSINSMSTAVVANGFNEDGTLNTTGGETGGETELKTENITLTVGQTSKEYTQDNDVTGKVNADGYDSTIASYTAEYKKVEGNSEPTLEKVDVTVGLTNNVVTYTGVISDNNGHYLAINNGQISSVTDASAATVFTVTNYYGGSYYAIAGNNYYLCIEHNGNLGVSSSLEYHGYLTYDATKGFKGYYASSYYLTYVDGTGWTVDKNGNSNVALYKVTTETTDPVERYATVITFTGKKVGNTSIIIGNVQYNIEVVKENLENVTPLVVEYWITNSRINGADENGVDQGVQHQQISIRATDNNVATPGGVEIAQLVHPKGVKDGRTQEYWQSKILDVEQSNNSTSGTELQTTKEGDDETLNGTAFTKVRYYGSKWQVYTTEWIDVDRSQVTVNYTGDNNSSQTYSGDKNQLVAYYMEVVDIKNVHGTNDLHINAADWGTKGDGSGSWGYTPEPNRCSVSIQLVYEDNTRNPNGTTADDLKSKTIVYGYWDGGRGLGTMIFNGQGNYQIYKVTAETGDMTSTTGSNNTVTVTGFEWDNNEETVWEGDLTNSVSIGNPARNPSYDEPKDNLAWNTSAYNKNNAILIRVYVKYIANKDALHVNYYIDGTTTKIYDYSIEVGETTTFDPDFARTDGGELINNTVNDYYGVLRTVLWDLKLMPQVSAQYRYTKYNFVRAERVDEGKTVNLYYTFDATKTFVVDFGLPMVIKPTDMNDNLATAMINSVEIGQKTTCAKITADDSHNITYTLTQTIDGEDNFSLKYYGSLKTEDGTQTGEVEYSVKVIPATNVYYEDSFAKFIGGAGAAAGATWTIFNNNGDTLTEQQQKDSYTNQALEALGTKENVYGYDRAYQNSTMFSMGSARKVTVTQDMVTNWNDTTSAWPTAQFTFKGTGFDIISLTDNTSGAIFVDVVNAKTGVKAKSLFVNNYYGYKYNEATQTWETVQTGNNALYQIPVIAVRDLGYDEYNVVISVAYNTFFDKTTKQEYSFWLDAVRVYDPMGKDNAIYNTWNEKEGYPQYIKLRSELIKLGESAAGALFIDGKENANISEYANYGPNNEVYLANGQAITFKLEGNDLSKIATVQIGAKAPNGNAKLVVNSKEVKELGTATEMYYTIERSGDNTFTISNTGNGILSLTNLKITYTEKGNVSLGAMNETEQTASVMAVRALFAPAPIEPEPEPEPEKTFEPERFEASWSRNVMQGRKATLTVKTSEDVEAITVDGQTIRSYRTRTERVGFGRRAKRITYREFTYSMVAQESADFSVTAINAEGTESEAITARLTVKTRPNSLRDMWDWFKGWF